MASACFAILVAGCGGRNDRQPASGSAPPPATEATASSNEVDAYDAKRALALYTQHCSGCHGERGDGQGIAARFLFPKPRDFRAGRFRLVSTTNGVPAPEDIAAVIRRGMPGSAMPPWPQIAAEDRQLLVEQVLAFRREGARDVELQLAAEDEVELSEEELAEGVARVTTPGDLFEVPDLGEPTPDVIQRGKEIYLAKGCASCHGQQGRGDGQEKMVDAEGLPTAPRDLTKGIFKGSPDPASVFRRIAAGMPGTPMPASQNLSNDEVAALVHFVLSLSDERTRAATVLNREQLKAHYVSVVEDGPDAAFWNDIPAVALRTMPLWWRDDPYPWVDVQAAHDGETLLFRLSWEDADANTSALRSEDFQDAVAVQLYRGDAEPFLGMGTMDQPIDVWMWGAARDGSSGDVEDVNPRMVVDVYPFAEQIAETAEFSRPATRTSAQPPLALPAVAVGNLITPSAEARKPSTLVVGGPGTVTFRPKLSQLAEAQAEWKDGRWIVVLKRPLVVGDAANGVSLEPGGTASVAFAVWQGSLRDRNGQKRVTIWQDFEILKP